MDLTGERVWKWNAAHTVNREDGKKKGREPLQGEVWLKTKGNIIQVVVISEKKKELLRRKKACNHFPFLDHKKSRYHRRRLDYIFES